SIEKVVIKLSCDKQNGYLKITIENNFDPEAVSNKGQGIGLENVKRRLNLVYGKSNLLCFEKQNDIFRVDLFIPIEN
ncbi:MAG: GHKL domain-containing protein, partial [Ignavibacteria bacterium]|nr:GHKL domain-containing protein [Ignavibacteria bacterium]